MLSIAAYDAAGNCGEHSFNVYVNNSGDTVAPVVEIFAPQNNDTVSDYIVLRAKATDNLGVDHVDFNILDGTWVLLGTDYYPIGDNEYAILWDTRNIPDGRYGIEAVAYDAVANKAYDRIGITIDNSGSIAGDDSFIYEGRKYQYKTIGTQTWMTENLAYMPFVRCSSSGSNSPLCYFVYGYRGASRDIARHLVNYQDYGVLYNWEAAKSACPTGWHLPNDEEWKTLEKYLGMSSSDADGSGWRNSGDVGLKLKSTSLWTDNGNGDNSSGFQALPGGYLTYDFDYLGFMADFWTSSQSGDGFAWGRTLRSDHDGVYRSGYDKSHSFSVRCIKDN